jgi:uncharacterized protein YprB with RNaseH-like and TPR domain
VGIEDRLRLLRAETSPGGPEAVAPRSAEQGDLAARLRRLATAERRARPRTPPEEGALAEVLGASRLAPGVLGIEERVPLGHLPGGGAHGVTAALPALLEGQADDSEDWCFLDTETSGLAGGTGTWAFLCGLASIRGSNLLIRQFLLTRLDAEPAYLEALRAELEPARLLVSYNGRAFDLPLLITRLRLAGIRSGLETKSHLDLLFPVRRAFASRWPDCRLATAEARLLGLAREGDLPGSMAPTAWLAWLRQGETGPVAGVVEHNRRDLFSLPALVPPLERALREPGPTGADVHALARHRLRRGDSIAALALLAADRAWLDESGLLALARLHRRHGQWAEAIAIWEPLAARGQSEALEALAKQLEHRVGDFATALAMARRLPPGAERERRCRRLEGRIGTPRFPPE